MLLCSTTSAGGDWQKHSITTPAIFIFMFLKESCWLWKKAKGLPRWPGCFVWRWRYRRLCLQASLLRFSKHIMYCGTTWPLTVVSINPYFR